LLQILGDRNISMVPKSLIHVWARNLQFTEITSRFHIYRDRISSLQRLHATYYRTGSDATLDLTTRGCRDVPVYVGLRFFSTSQRSIFQISPAETLLTWHKTDAGGSLLRGAYLRHSLTSASVQFHVTISIVQFHVTISYYN